MSFLMFSASASANASIGHDARHRAQVLIKTGATQAKGGLRGLANGDMSAKKFDQLFADHKASGQKLKRAIAELGKTMQVFAYAVRPGAGHDSFEPAIRKVFFNKVQPSLNGGDAIIFFFQTFDGDKLATTPHGLYDIPIMHILSSSGHKAIDKEVAKPFAKCFSWSGNSSEVMSLRCQT